MMNEHKQDIRCNTCTIKLVEIAYQRAPWFRLVREPLKLGMRLLSRFHHIDPEDFIVRTPACVGCIRFYKVTLKQRSGLFLWLNERVNPVFDAWLEGIITPDELSRAKDYARRASDGQVPVEESSDWLSRQKTGF